MTPEFATHRLNEAGMRGAKALAEEFDALLTEVQAIVGPSGDPRQLALCRTHLEEACFHAKKALAVQSGFQEPAP